VKRLIATAALAGFVALTGTTCGGLVVFEEFYPDNPCDMHRTCDVCEAAAGCGWLRVSGCDRSSCNPNDLPLLPQEGCYPTGGCVDGCPEGRECVQFLRQETGIHCDGSAEEISFVLDKVSSLCVDPDWQGE